MHGDPTRLASVLEEVRRLEGGSYDRSLRIFFLRNFTIEGIDPFLKLHLFKAGIRPEVQFGDYGVIDQQILDSQSALHQFTPDLVILSLHLESLDPSYLDLDWTSADTIERIQATCTALLESTRAVIGLNNFVAPIAAEYGISLPADAPERTLEVGKLNLFVRELVKQHPGRVFLADWDGFIRRLGDEACSDRRFWYMSKAPFKKAFLDAYAQDIAKAARALSGKTKKCLVLDCDGTLWGGIVGEDGMEGIQLDPNSYPGNVYYDFQRTLLALSRRGVILALNSKNNPADVCQVLDTHPHCLLKREHIASERINWEDKASNLSSLADELNLGLDSFVFVDDNPVECDLVRQLLPQVTVLQVPSAIYDYRDLVAGSGLFDALTITTEDRTRTQMYRSERDRTVLKQSVTSVEGYLAGLEMVATIHEVTVSEIPRVAQLTQKTNQFNLTTRRYSASQIEGFTQDPDFKLLSLSVRDRFGDLGLTGVLVAQRIGSTASIEAFLLSCRILGRQLEHAFLDVCFDKMERAWELTRWNAEFIPTRKNEQVQSFWSDVGFGEIATVETVKKYSLGTAGRPRRRIPFISIQE